ncbi:hypothetical protein JCM8097_003078 [Rhodosporidiobolus ruineniae]
MCLPCLLPCLLSVKNWVAFASFILAAGYFAGAYVLREVIFPLLKTFFEEWLSYQILHSLLEEWVADVKLMFYGALAYVAIGLAGCIGAILEVGVLLIVYAIYLLITFGINAWKIWTVLQSVLDAEADVKKACNVIIGVLSLGTGNCNDSFAKLEKWSWIGAGAILFLHSITLICVLVLLHRIKKETGTFFLTFCGHRCGGRGKKSTQHDLEKAIPAGRRRRGGARTALLQAREGEKTAAALPDAVFAIPRRNERAVPQRAEQEEATTAFEVGKSARRRERRRRGPARYGEEDGGIEMRSLGKRSKKRRQEAELVAALQAEEEDSLESGSSSGLSRRSSDSATSSAAEGRLIVMKTSFAVFAATAAAASLFSSAAANPIAVPLQKRGDEREDRQLTRRDGTVNWELFDAHVHRAVDKYHRTAEAYRQQHGHMPMSNASEKEERSADFYVAPREARKEKRQATTTSRAPRVPFRDRTTSVANAVTTSSSSRRIFYPAPVTTTTARTTTTTARPTTSTTSTTSIRTTSLGTTQAPIATSVAQPSVTSSSSVAPTVRPSSGAVSLIDELNDSLWAGTLSIGTPASPFLIDFDTGSSDLWVPSVSCTSQACARKRKYDPTKSSSSLSVPSKQLNIRYGDGSTTSGGVYTDTVTIAGLTAVNQTLGSATTLSASWVNDPQDGLAGMGYQSLSQLRSAPFFQSLVAQGKLSSPMFSFKLSSTSVGPSELFLGGMNPQYYVAGTTQWTPVTYQAYWSVNAQVQVNGNAVSTPLTSFIVDTGTTVNVAPTSWAAAFYANVPGAAAWQNGYYTVPCNAVPTISFTFAGTTTRWPISQFNLGRTGSGSSLCVGSIVGQDIGINGVILGDNFLKNVYATFDLGNNRVGFSQQKQA